MACRQRSQRARYSSDNQSSCPWPRKELDLNAEVPVGGRFYLVLIVDILFPGLTLYLSVSSTGGEEIAYSSYSSGQGLKFMSGHEF